jgi:DNA-binding NarL/FixJ family response regulator
MTAPAEPGGLVLIVDDDPDAREMLRAALAGAGLTPITAPDGAAALVLLDELTPDLILLDAVMPPPDGFETCRRIKQRVGLAATPVMFMTGLTETEHVVAGLRAGGVDYVTKPVLLDELIARVRVHIATGGMTRSAQRALDTAGRKLVAADAEGQVRWLTPQAGKLLRDCDIAIAGAPLTGALRQLIASDASTALSLDAGGRRIEITAIASISGDHFFRVTELIDGLEAILLKDALGLTPREGDVLRWIAAGKSNRDISDILNISARTVNKHLEQIYVKLGVENRAAAAAIATRIISTQS